MNQAWIMAKRASERKRKVRLRLKYRQGRRGRSTRQEQIYGENLRQRPKDRQRNWQI